MVGAVEFEIKWTRSADANSWDPNTNRGGCKKGRQELSQSKGGRKKRKQEQRWL